MNSIGLRVSIFSMWVLFWVATSVILLLAPVLRTAIGFDQSLQAIGLVATIWLPILSCFAAFWFPETQYGDASRSHTPKDKAFAAITITFIYLSFISCILAWIIFVVDYDAPEYLNPAGLAKGQSFEDQIAFTVKMALWISPVATAPVVWLTGSRVRHQDME